MQTLETTLRLLRETAVATVATILKQKGYRNIWMNGPRALMLGQPRVAGPAFTLRFIPTREDIPVQQAIWGPGSPRAALSEVKAGEILVIDAMGSPAAGVLGDILCGRMQTLGVAGLVTDGAVRDAAALRRLGWPVWSSGASAPPSTAAFYSADQQVPVACGGVAVFPGDIIAADEDGAVVIPATIAAAVAVEAFEEDRLETWIAEQVAAGAPIKGLYPPDEAAKARFRATLKPLDVR